MMISLNKVDKSILKSVKPLTSEFELCEVCGNFYISIYLHHCLRALLYTGEV